RSAWCCDSSRRYIWTKSSASMSLVPERKVCAILTTALGETGPRFRTNELSPAKSLETFDRSMAITLGKNEVAWDALLYLLIGLTVSMAVLSVGPLIAFGFLLIPALTAHLFAANMRQ